MDTPGDASDSQTSPLVYARVPLPRPSPWRNQSPGPGAIPPAQPPVFYQGPSPAPPLSGGFPGMAQGLANGLAGGINNHALTLMALGAGIAQGGVGRGLELATSAAQAEHNRQLQQVSYLQTYKALTDGGVPPQEAQAAITNPSLMRAVVSKYLGSRASGNAGSRVAPAGAATPAPAQAGAVNYPAGATQYDAPIAPQALGRSPAAPSAPPLPPRVPNGAHFSPSRNMWRDGDGNLFDLSGKAVV